ncbi:hypothetical protein ACEQPO_20750 [Bacillus sp. SL00103]
MQEPPFFEPPKLLDEEEREDTFFEVEVRKIRKSPKSRKKTIQPYPVFEQPAYHLKRKRRRMIRTSSDGYMNEKRQKYMSQLKKKRHLKKT